MTNSERNELAESPHAPVHGMMGMHEIIDVTCAVEPLGAVELGGRSEKDVTAFLFGRIHDMVAKDDQPSRNQLSRLGDAMATTKAKDVDGPAPAGVAFLGQLLDHDMTLDATTKLTDTMPRKATQIKKFRTPFLDLDCVYCDGPEVDPWLYDMDGKSTGIKGSLLFGHDGNNGSPANALDLQRNRIGRALIGDPATTKTFLSARSTCACSCSDTMKSRRHSPAQPSTSTKPLENSSLPSTMNEYPRRS